MGRHSLGGAGALAGEINGILLELNQQITILNNLKSDVAIAGSRILALQAGDMDVAISGGALMNVFPESMGQLINAYKMHIQTLEDYRDRIQ